MTTQQAIATIQSKTKETDISICKLAKETGISKSQLSKMFSGKCQKPSYGNIITLLKYFGVKKIII